MRVILLGLVIGTLLGQPFCGPDGKPQIPEGFSVVDMTGGRCPKGPWAPKLDWDAKRAELHCAVVVSPPPASPSVTPSASPAPSPSPSPSPTFPPSPSPSPSPVEVGQCPAPFAVKLGFSQEISKRDPGWRHTASITPLVRGACTHKNDPSPNAVCAASEFCADHVGSEYWNRYGQPQAWQTGNGFTRHPVERSTDSCNKNDPGQVPCGYNLAFVTNSREEWVNGKYIYAGPMEVCVSMGHLSTMRCQSGTMGQDGKMYGFGQDAQGVDKPKPAGARWPKGPTERR